MKSSVVTDFWFVFLSYPHLQLLFIYILYYVLTKNTTSTGCGYVDNSYLHMCKQL
jgi:hypothetical protein